MPSSSAASFASAVTAQKRRHGDTSLASDHRGEASSEDRVSDHPIPTSAIIENRHELGA
jgi:hypothetical protein